MERGEKITLRSVADQLRISHTTLSRAVARKKKIAEARDLQVLAERIKITHRGSAQKIDSYKLARAKVRITQLETRNALLVTFHIAMIMAVGELGE